MENLADKATNIVRMVIISMLVILVVYIFAKYLLPLVLVIGLGIFLYVKIKGYLGNTFHKEDNNVNNVNNMHSAKEYQTYDDLDGDVVDVDYKDV
jgi:hypothetical protein